MDDFNFERFQMSGPMYIYVSKKTRKLHAIELSSNKLQLVKNMGAEAYVIVKGLLLTAMQFETNEFYCLIKYVDKEDPFVRDAMIALRNCCHNEKLNDIIRWYLA